ncbi:hypothetical protein N9K85_01240 [Flavobacteriaceae bacterium]|nr:hypothetical protein [Flavobacteriaceae bacterium]MDB2631672.1 hypothetical protein [Flavobacteriaceae bacterium]
MNKRVFLILFFSFISILQISCEKTDKSINKEALVLNSFNKNPAPLYVLDGVVVNRIDTLSPSSIAEINVLKDQKTIEKYGQKGKQGVIEIITKKE